MTTEYPKMEIYGIPGYSNTAMHFDVTGGFGGKRAIFAHFRKDEDDLQDLLYAYILVGPDVVQFKSPLRDVPTSWEIAKLVTEAMENGADRKRLYDAIIQAIES